MMRNCTIQKLNVTHKMIAEEMSRQTPWHVSSEMITPLKQESPNMAVYAAQTGDVTILRWAHIDGNFTVKHTCW